MKPFDKQKTFVIIFLYTCLSTRLWITFLFKPVKFFLFGLTAIAPHIAKCYIYINDNYTC